MSLGVVKLSGGLGNQMFQYAFSLKLMEVNLHDVVKVDPFLGFETSESGKYECALGRVFPNLRENFATANDLHQFFNFRSRIINYIAKKSSILNGNVYVNHTLCYDQKALSSRSSTYYDGYWQSYKYLPPLGVLKQSFVLSDSCRLDILRHASFIAELADPRTVAIHVRGGDYLSDSNAYKMLGSVLSRSFYIDAMQAANSYILNPKYFVFSDDIKYARSIFQGVSRVEYAADRLQTNDSAFELYLLSQSRNLIIGNSTFALWGGLLGRDRPRLILAPDKWINNASYRISDIIPPDFVKIPLGR